MLSITKQIKKCLRKPELNYIRKNKLAEVAEFNSEVVSHSYHSSAMSSIKCDVMFSKGLKKNIKLFLFTKNKKMINRRII